MKIKKLIFFCLFGPVIFAQNIKVTGVILDKESQKPIFGTAVWVEENIMGFSDVDGKFSFTLDTTQINTTVAFVHITYEEIIIPFENFDNNKIIIELSPKYNKLSEVVISASNQTLTTKDIIKKASKKLDEINREAPYWSSINYKQIIYLNGNPHSYLEFDGNIFMVGEHRNPGIGPLLAPNQIRRTTEAPEIVFTWWGKKADEKDFLLKQEGGRFANTDWINYRFFEVAHPLGKKGGDFEFQLEGSEVIEGKEFYVIYYHQNKEISLKGRWLDYMHGKLWIAKDDFALEKATTGFRFERIGYHSYTVDYSVQQNTLYPSKIEISGYKFPTPGEDAPNVVITAEATFKNIDYTERENYRLEIPTGSWIIESGKYDPDYWKDHPIQNVKFKNALLEIAGKNDLNTIFEEGAQEKEYKEIFYDKQAEFITTIGEKFLSIMKRDLKL